MAKRFTDTNKWDKAWFRSLGSGLRDVRQYLLDKCDNAGIWEVDLDTLAHFTGQAVTLEDIQKAFRGEVYPVGNDKLFIPGFIQFQYGELSETSKPHVSVIKRLKSLTLWEAYQRVSSTLKDKEKEKDMDKEEDKEQNKDSGTVTDFWQKRYAAKYGVPQ